MNANQIDRTTSMGLFPHDDHRTVPVERRPSQELADIAVDDTKEVLERDQALWNLVYRQQQNLGGLLLKLAREDPSVEIRRSAAWGLLKLGNANLLEEVVSESDDENTRHWKLHLIHEAFGDTTRFDQRQVRLVDNSFDITMPLSVEGVVQFKDKEGTWNQMIVSQSARAALVGVMTAAINVDTFDTELVIQKRIEDIEGSGTDFIDGYLFKGISRYSGLNTMTHYYESSWNHQFYKAGRIGDESEGTIDVMTHLYRIAETDLVKDHDIDYPYPQSVRGIFHGPVSMNPVVLEDSSESLDGLMQIVSAEVEEDGPIANGWFYGSFRGVPEDVDGDDVVELNGIEMFVSPGGKVMERSPKTSQGNWGFLPES